MKIPIYHIDAFTSQVFKGNPAAVCLLDNWLADPVLQAIASENNLSETAFILARKDGYEIRWFSPLVEIDLCGHATLASGFVLFHLMKTATGRVRFFSPRSGELAVTEGNGLLTLDFPSQPPAPCPAPPALLEALKIKPVQVLKSEDYLVVCGSEEEVAAMMPDFERLKQLDLRGVIVTARGNQVDFVSRFFAPKVGINEDPVTGSAHCALVPYWKSILNKGKLHARQVSKRGGELFCEDAGLRVLIAGHAVCYMQGEIVI